VDCVVLVPRRPEPHRDSLWAYVRERVEAEVDWPIIEGLDEGEQPMNRAAARNRAAEQAGDWDVAVFLDADTVPDFDNLRRAVELADGSPGGRLALAQNEFRSLTHESTEQVLAGKIEPTEAAVRWVYPNPKSSCIAIGRATWEKVGGYDERFDGWGWEDASIFHACQALFQVSRLDGACSHLWHPRSPEKDPASEAYRANEVLGARYKAARRDPDAMRGILAELGGPLAHFHRGGPVPAGGTPALNCGCVR
jgi:hypothetical protein